MSNELLVANSPLFSLFLRINTQSTLMADTCMSLLCDGNNSYIVKNTENDNHFPGTFKENQIPRFNSGDMLLSNDCPNFFQENPSRNRILRAFCAGNSEADEIFSAFNQINLSNEHAGFMQLPKPTFSEVISERFLNRVRTSVKTPFIFISETKNPQIIMYPGDGKPFNWIAIHDDYTYLLIATQKSYEEIQDLIVPHIPGCYVFYMAVSGTNLAFHPLFITQKFRRLEKSTSTQSSSEGSKSNFSGNLRALAGVEEYLNRLSSIDFTNRNLI